VWGIWLKRDKWILILLALVVTEFSRVKLYRDWAIINNINHHHGSKYSV
jgi:hypothetical protein